MCSVRKHENPTHFYDSELFHGRHSGTQLLRDRASVVVRRMPHALTRVGERKSVVQHFSQDRRGFSGDAIERIFT